jgi:hypothetical protein
MHASKQKSEVPRLKRELILKQQLPDEPVSKSLAANSCWIHVHLLASAEMEVDAFIRLAYTGIDPYYTGIGYRGIYIPVYFQIAVYGPSEGYMGLGTCPREGPFLYQKHIKQIQRHSKVFLSRRASKLCQRRRHCEHVRLRRQQGPSQQQLACQQYNLRFISITRSIRAGGTLGMSTRGCPIGGPQKCGYMVLLF